MAGLKPGYLLLALAMIVALFYGHHANADVACGGDFVNLYQACKDYVQIPGEQKDPSEECCDAIQHADLPCVCQNIPPEVEKFISVKKVAYVAKKCNRPIKSGTKCGSLTIPLQGA